MLWDTIVLSIRNFLFWKKKTTFECIWLLYTKMKKIWRVFLSFFWKEEATTSKWHSTEEGCGQGLPQLLISDFRGQARAEEPMMWMIWCNGLLSITTGHLHRHEFIYQGDTAGSVFSGLYLHQQACWPVMPQPLLIVDQPWTWVSAIDFSDRQSKTARNDRKWVVQAVMTLTHWLISKCGNRDDAAQLVGNVGF